MTWFPEAMMLRCWAALSQLQPPCQLLADDLHLLGHLRVATNDQAGCPLGS